MANNAFDRIPRGLFSLDWPPPPGYRKVSWLDVRHGDEVYIMDLLPPNAGDEVTGTKARGPFRVVDAKDRWLEHWVECDEGARQTRVQECGERLCVPGSGTYEVWWRRRRSWHDCWGLLGRTWTMRSASQDLELCRKRAEVPEFHRHVYDLGCVWEMEGAPERFEATTRELDSRGKRVESKCPNPGGE